MSEKSYLPNPTPTDLEHSPNVPEWFRDAKIQDMTSPMGAAQSVTRKPHSKVWIPIITIFIIIVGLYTAWYVYSHTNHTVCLTSSDFTDLTKINDEFQGDTVTYFYDAVANFNKNITSYSFDPAATPTGVDTVAKIGEFYKRHRNKSLAIKIETYTLSGFDNTPGREHMTKQLKDALVSAGIPTSIITESTVTYEAPDDPEGDGTDSPDQYLYSATLSLTSTNSCQE